MPGTGSEPGWLLRSFEWKRRTRSSKLWLALEEAGAALDVDRDPLDADITSATLPALMTPSKKKTGAFGHPSPQYSTKSKATATNSVFVTAAAAAAQQQTCLDISSSSSSPCRVGLPAAQFGNNTLRFPKGGRSEPTSLQASETSDHRLSVSPHDCLRQSSTPSDASDQECALRRRRCSGEVSPQRPPQGGTEETGPPLGEDDCADSNEGRRGDGRVSDDDDGGGGGGGGGGNTDTVTIEPDADIDEDDCPSLLLERELVRRKRRRRAVSDITASALLLPAPCSVGQRTKRHISLEGSSDWVGQPEPAYSRAPAHVNVCNSDPSLEEDTPSEEDAAALVARLQPEYGNGVSGMDGVCTTREQTAQVDEIPNGTSDRQAAARVSPSDYRYGSKTGTAGDRRTRGCPGVGCGAGCGYKAAWHFTGGTTAGGTDYTPCDNRVNHVDTGHFGGEQTNETAAGAGVISAGECWNNRPASANLVKSGGSSFCVAHCMDGDKTPSPLPSPPAPQTSTKWRGTSKLRQPPLEADHLAATSSLLLHEHEHQNAHDPPRCAPRPDRNQQRGGDTEYGFSGHGADPVCIASAVCLDEMESVRPHAQDVSQPMPETTARHQPLRRGSSPPSPENDVSPKTQCEGPAGTLPRRRLQDEGGTNKALQQSTTKCSPQHTSLQHQEPIIMSANARAGTDAGVLSPSPTLDSGTSSAARDGEKEQDIRSCRRDQPCFAEPASGNQQGDNTSTLPLVGQEGPWLRSAIGSKPGTPIDCGAEISCRLAADERLLLGKEEAAATDADGDEKPTGAGPAASIALAPHACCQSAPNGQHVPTERTQEDCEVGARLHYAADTGSGLPAKHIAVQEEEYGGDFGLIALRSEGVSGAPEEVQQVLQLGEMALCDRAQYRQCRATDRSGEAPGVAVQSLSAVRSPARIIPAVIATALCSDPTDADAVRRPGETRPEVIEVGGGAGKGGVAGIGVTGGCQKRTSQHQRRQEHDGEEVVVLMSEKNVGGDCTGGDDNESQRQQQQNSAKTWARYAIRRWLLRSLRCRQYRTECAMGTRLTGDHAAAPVDRGFDAARDGGMHPAVGSHAGVVARTPSAEALPGMHIQSTVVALSRATGEQEPAVDKLLDGVPRSEVSYQASCGIKSASPAPEPEQPWKVAVPAGRGSTSGGCSGASSVATTCSVGRSGSPAHVGCWPPQESPTTSTGRRLPHHQEVDDHQTHRVSCRPATTSPKVERPLSGSSPLGVGADRGRDGHVLPRGTSISARGSGHMYVTCAAASLFAALPFRAAPPPLGRAASLLPAGGEAGVEVQEEEWGSNRGLDQGGTVGVGTTGVRMVVGDVKRGVSFCDERPEHPVAAVEGQRRPPAPPPPCQLTNHCHSPPRRRFGKPLGWSSVRDNSVRLAASSSMGTFSVREQARDRQGGVRQAGCRNGRRSGGVWGETGIDTTGTFSKSERQGVCFNGRSDSVVCGGGGGIDTTGRAPTPEGVCPSQTGVDGATALVVPPVSPPPHEAAAAVTLLLAGGAIGRRRDIVAARTFRNPLLEALDVSNPLLGAAVTSNNRGLDD